MSSLQWCRKKASGYLIIQTAKIGDYANTTPMFEYLGKTDVLIDCVNRALQIMMSVLKRFTVSTLIKKGFSQN